MMACVIRRLLELILDTFGHILYFVGAGVLLSAAVWSFIVICRENAVLAVICLFLPIGLMGVLIMWLPRTWRPLGLWVIGFVIFFCGLSLTRPGS